jgi:uncharacterized membrane protein YcaP (DUF421 family)
MATVLRVVIIYLFLMVSLRILGKREFGEMSPLEFISLLLVPELVSNALQGEDYSLVDAIVGISTLFALTVITSLLIHVSKTAEKVITGEPTVLIHHGRILDKSMNKERVTLDEILSEIHKAGLERVEQVAWAILEGDGKIAIVPETNSDQTSPKQSKRI